MILDVALRIVRLGLDLAEIIMKGDPDIDTTETEEAIVNLRGRLEEYERAKAVLRGDDKP